MDNSYLKYLKYKNKYLKLKRELDGEQYGGSEDNEIMLFKAEWCGHCQNFKNDWEQLQNDKFLKSKYTFKTFDSDNDKKKMEEYKIKGFPTLFVRKNNKTVEYSGPMNKLNIEFFISNL